MRFRIKESVLTGLLKLGLVGYLAPIVLVAGGPAPVAISFPDNVSEAFASDSGLTEPSIVRLRAQFGNEPEDAEIVQAKILLEPLIPVEGAVQKGENKALAKALAKYADEGDPEAVQPLERFLTQFPASRWAPAVELNLGLICYQTGYFGKSLDYYRSVWERTRSSDAEPASIWAGRAISEYAVLCAKVGRQADLDGIFDATSGRAFTGSDETRLQGAKDGHQLMKNRPQVAFKCGPYAVNSIIKKATKKKGLVKAVEEIDSTASGTSLAQVDELAKAAGLKYRQAKRAAGARVLFPSVVHWKVGHFAAITDFRDGKYLVEDPTFGGGELWVSQRAIDEEASGYFLIPDEGKLPAGWVNLAQSEGKSVWGRGAAGQRDERAKTADQSRVPCPGMATPSAFPMQATLRIEDMPVYYVPPIGPAMNFIISYNHLEADQPSIMDYPNLGPNWTMNWVSYLTVDSSKNVIVRVRGGGSEFYKWSLADNIKKVYAPDRNSCAVVSYGSGFYERRLPDGTVELFTQPGSTGPFGRFFLTKVTDPAGNSVTLNYTVTTNLPNSPRLTSITDAMGEATTITYVGNSTTATVEPAGYYTIKTIDTPHAQNQVATFAYDASYKRLLSITDAVGLKSEFHYKTLPALAGQSSEAVTSFIDRLTTPYGDTYFEAYDFSHQDNTGSTQQIDTGRGLRIIYPDNSQVVVENMLGHIYQSHYWDRRAFAATGGQWKGKALSLPPTDPLTPSNLDKAVRYTFLREGTEVTTVLASIKKPLEGEVFFDYAGRDGVFVGGSSRPTKIWRTLDTLVPVLKADGTPQLDTNGQPVVENEVQTTHLEYNPLGKVTRTTDAQGRQVTYRYAANDIDLVEVSQTSQPVGGARGNDILGEWYYDIKHLPNAYRDASGYRTDYVYNARGQIRSVTNAKGEQTKFIYSTAKSGTEPPDSATAYGYLRVIDGPLSGPQDKVHLQYDDTGRVLSMKDSGGYEITYEYDALNRPVATNYPGLAGAADDTSEEIIWGDRLDPVLTKDRLGRWSSYKYDSRRQLTSQTDAEGRSTTFNWCDCGSLSSYTNAEGRTTSFDHDLQGRLTARVYPDLSRISYTYQPLSGWLDKVTESGQEAAYGYYSDGRLKKVAYTEPGKNTLATSYEYDSYYGRPTKVSNEWGQVDYAYHLGRSMRYPNWSTNITGEPFGRGQLKSIRHTLHNPDADTAAVWADSDVVYAYDILGRVESRKIGKEATAVFSNSESYTYDPAGRLKTIVNNLTQGAAPFTLSYLNEDLGLSELSGLAYPRAGIATSYSWHDNGKDHKLSAILNKVGATQVSYFGYDYLRSGGTAYRPANEITDWVKQLGDTSSPKTRSKFEYDDVGQLRGAKLSNEVTQAPLGQAFYFYDKAGNRRGVQTDGVVSKETSNSLDQLTSVGGGGPFRFEGVLDEPGTVVYGVNGGAIATSAEMLTSKSFRAEPILEPGRLNYVDFQARDGRNNVTTPAKRYQVNVPPSSNNARNYDVHGNLLNDGAGKSFTWDAMGRLESITFGSVGTADYRRSEFRYDALGQRVQQVEYSGTNAVPLAKNHLWAGGSQPTEERVKIGAAILVKRFYDHGFESSNQSERFYYIRDHLGSIRQIVDANGVVRAHYDYSNWGERTKVAGDIEADFGFTGHYFHQASGLCFTIFRVYDSRVGRWLSRDPMGEIDGANLYAYAINSPLNNTDVEGLSVGSWIMERLGFDPNARYSISSLGVMDDADSGSLLEALGTSIDCAGSRNLLASGSAQLLDDGATSLAMGGVFKVAKAALKPTEQYVLKALDDGFYPVMKRGYAEAQAGIYLAKNAVWKYGITRNPSTRYSSVYLLTVGRGLRYEREFVGNRAQALARELSQIVAYIAKHGKLPPGNKVRF